MKRFTLLLIALVVVLGLAVVLVVLAVTTPKHPVAMIQVVDAIGQPIAGATIQPEGLRTKSGPYRSGWYGWRMESHGVSNAPAITGTDGYVRVPYPRFVFERIETGVLCLALNHPDFVPARPECIVATAPPAGAPWRVWAQYLWDRVRRKTLIARTDPIVLQQGAALRVSISGKSETSPDAQLFAQVSGQETSDTNFWARPEPGVIFTRRLAAGTHTVRAVLLNHDGAAWFSEVVSVTAVTGQTNELSLPLKPGVSVRGQLDATVPRPVTNGRVVAKIWPRGAKAQTNPPQWHGWAAVQANGTFVIHSLPAGDLEIVALCNGFVSTNGPGKFQFRYPQKQVIGSNDLEFTVGMEPTARLEVKVTDGTGRALPDVRVMTWPNVRYGEWSATILVSDCHNTSDFLLEKKDRKNSRRQPVLDFEGVSDSAGLAVLANLPLEVNQLSVEHPQFTLPIIRNSSGQQHRQAGFTLVTGQTNRLSVQLEPKDSSTITHY